ncbi:MAG: hypothetical protein ACPF9D_01090 [Owenweeksia sp.]
MKWYLLLCLLFVLASCGKDDPGPGEQIGQKPTVTIVSPLVQIDYSDSVDVVIRFADDRGLQSAAISLTRNNGNLTYHSSVRQLDGSTADTLQFKAWVTGGTNISGSNTISVQCLDTDNNVTLQEELFTVRENVDPAVVFTFFDKSVSSAPNQVIQADFTLSDNLGLDKYKAELWEINAQDQPQTLWKSFNKAGLNGEATFSASHKFLSNSSGYPAGSKYRVLVTVEDVSGNIAVHESETGIVN